MYLRVSKKHELDQKAIIFNKDNLLKRAVKKVLDARREEVFSGGVHKVR